jgi:hypothetical protein
MIAIAGLIIMSLWFTYQTWADWPNFKLTEGYGWLDAANRIFIVVFLWAVCAAAILRL